MKTVKVESSNIESVGYDPDERRLHVEFKSGHKIDHLDVPPEEHSRFMAASSHGKHYAARIKDQYVRRSTAAVASAPTGRPQGSPPINAEQRLEQALRRFRGEE